MKIVSRFLENYMKVRSLESSNVVTHEIEYEETIQNSSSSLFNLHYFRLLYYYVTTFPDRRQWKSSLVVLFDLLFLLFGLSAENLFALREHVEVELREAWF